jgi:hypothetical protein
MPFTFDRVGIERGVWGLAVELRGGEVVEWWGGVC